MGYEGLPFEVVELKPGRRFNLYTVRFQGFDRTEIEKWKENDKINSHDEFDQVWSSFRAIPNEGLPEDCFKRSNYQDYGWVTPFVGDEHMAELRLYCIHRKGSNWVLAGNGCVKPGGGSLQDYPDCEFAFENICSIDRRIRQDLGAGTKVDPGNRGEYLIENPFFGPE